MNATITMRVETQAHSTLCHVERQRDVASIRAIAKARSD